jgi:uncharacterized protein YjbI with pentapeptide repeats
MAKKRTAATAVSWDQQRFLGKTFVFAVSFYRWDREKATAIIVEDGGKVLDKVTATLDYLVVGQNSTIISLPQKQVMRLKKEQGASTQVLGLPDFDRLVTPDRALAEAMLRAGPVAVERWRRLRQGAATIVDLSGVDLRKHKLSEFWLWNINFDGADLREAEMNNLRVRFSNTRLDGAQLIETTVNQLSGCSARRANLTRLHFYGPPIERTDLTEANLSSCNGEKMETIQVDFSRANLTEARLNLSRHQDANFTGANLSRAKLRQASLIGAKLVQANLQQANLAQANLQNADLTGSDLTAADLCGADLSTAVLDRVKFDRTEYDEKTKLPPGFKSPGLHWKSAGPRPAAAVPPPKAPAEDLDLAAFMQRLPRKVEGGRLLNALQMLKSERFQLFSQVEEQALSGVVRSQSSEQRVYSCRLASDGSYHCCTQDLRVCGGLGGRTCKHLLVLIVGLAKAGQVDLGKVDQWLSAAQCNRPLLDKDSASAVFLKYEWAEAGEIDWTPTETVPEDFYAF